MILEAYIHKVLCSFVPCSHRPNTWYEDLKLEHEEVMTDLQRLQNENTEASEKVDELANLTVFYRGLHSQVLMEHTQLKEQVAMLRQEKKNRTEDWVLLKHHLEALKSMCEDQEEETSDLQTQQQQEFERLEGSLQVLLKRKEMITQEKDLAEKLQHHFEVYWMKIEYWMKIDPQDLQFIHHAALIPNRENHNGLLGLS
ncbi:disks large homolog 5-like [Peromyscus eremicus]|uniref:disks large homolog 5-like n=1 Tax=Peromyscus eremicus TaxID=42410 RepID=UPI0027DBB0A4|nr:disks large homolog 5-like [Peromyscus eremicus]